MDYQRLVKKLSSIIVLIILGVGLSGCYTSTFNPLIDEDLLVYENDDKSIRLEIGMQTSTHGRIYLKDDIDIKSFTVVYKYPQEFLQVYMDSPNLDDVIFILKLSYESVNFFKTNYDVMYIKSYTPSSTIYPDHELFIDFDTTLYRNYEKEVDPLNYFDNEFKTLDNQFSFINDDISYFYSNAIKGHMNDERVWIRFSDNSFSIWSMEDLNIKLAGTYYYQDLNIILEPFEWYEDTTQIILIFMNNDN